MSKYIQIKALKDLGSVSAGKIIKTLADDNGTPLSSFWRKRLKDAEIDNCCEIVTDKANKKPRSKKAEVKKSTD